MVTQSEVAKKAGVSTITVSRVVNNNGYVSEEIRKRVLAVIEELKYFPNSFGRGLNNNTINTIAVVIPVWNDDTRIFGDSFFMGVMTGIEQTCVKNNYDTLVTIHRDYGKDFNYLKPFYERKADGLILVAPNIRSPQLKEIEENNVPCVIVFERPESRISYIDSDNKSGARLMTEHLINMGHKKIGLVKGPSRNAADRYNEFAETMRLHGLEVREEWVLSGDFSIESGKAALRKLYEGKELPTALFCTNDLMAIGALEEAEKMNIKIPDDLSIAGYDGIEILRFIKPALTTVQQFTYEMGTTAAEILLRRIKGKKQIFETNIFPVELVPGKTVAMLKN
jgi:LacI family transcriptional regulator